MSDQRLARGYVQIYTGDGKGKITAALDSGQYDIVVLDEANIER